MPAPDESHKAPGPIKCFVFGVETSLPRAMNLPRCSLFFLGATLALTPGLLHANLIHRFSFAGGTVKDSIGQITGALKGENARLAGGQLVLKNAAYGPVEAMSYLEFSDSVLPKDGTSVSLLVWFTAKSVSPFARVYNLGSSEGSEGTHFIYFTPSTADGYARVAITGSDVSSKTFQDFSPLDDGSPHLVAVVIDGTAQTLRVFVDGQEVNRPEKLGGNTLDKVKPVENWLGRSSFAADPGLSASIDELRVYDEALTPEAIAAAHTAGSDSLPAK